MAFRSLSTLEEFAGRIWREGRAQTGDILISTVDGDVYGRVLVNIPEPQVSSNDELFGLES